MSIQQLGGSGGRFVIIPFVEAAVGLQIEVLAESARVSSDHLYVEMLCILLVHGADIEVVACLHHAHDVDTSQASRCAVGTEGMCGLLDAVL